MSGVSVRASKVTVSLFPSRMGKQGLLEYRSEKLGVAS